MLVTDSQIHLWEVDRPDRPWPQPPRNEPQREGGFSAEEALEAMDAAGVDRAVVVPPTWAGDHNDTALEAVARYPKRFAIMGRLDIDAPESRDRIATWKQQPGMLGIRLSFVGQSLPEDDGRLDWLWSACERHQVPLMMLMRGEPERVAPIASKYPDLTIVLDHMALDLTRPNPEVWESLDRQVLLARFPKVHVKISSAPNFSNEEYPYADIHPHIRRMYDAFGPARLFWGSDYTRLRGSYRDCVRLFSEALDFLSPADRELMLGKALADCLGWPEA